MTTVLAAIATPALAEASVSLNALHRGATTSAPTATEFAAGDLLTAAGTVDANRHFQFYLYDEDGDVRASTACAKAGSAAANAVTHTFTVPANAGVTPASKDWDVVLYQYGSIDSLCWLGWTSDHRGFRVKKPQTITFDPLADRTYGDADLTLSASSTSNQAVAFSLAGDSTGCALTGVKLELTGPGTCKVTATQSGNAAWLTAAPVTRAFAISAKELTGSFTAESKAYDGTDAAAIESRTLTGAVAGDDVALDGGTAAFDSPGAGTGKTVTGTGFALTGADAANYTLASSDLTTTADITAVELTGAFTAKSKVYDGDDAAEIDARTLTGMVGGDDVTLDGGTAAFDTEDVGTAKTVTGTGFALAGAQAANYTLASPDLSTTADITAKDLTGSFTAADKVFDGTDAATITGRALTGVVAGDDVTLTGGTATFADAQVGDDKTVTGTGFVLAGADQANYALASVATAKAKITAAPVVPTPQAQSPAPAPAPAPAAQPTQTTIASRSGVAPLAKLTLTSFKASKTCVTKTGLKSLKLSYTLSRAAKVTFTIAKRNPSMARKTCGKLKTVRSDGKYDDLATATTAKAAANAKSKAGVNTIALKTLLGKRTLKPGTYRVLAQATDTDGTKTVLKKVVFRVVG